MTEFGNLTPGDSTRWTPHDLREIGAAQQIRIATVRADGTSRSALPIWVVRVGDELFVRSYNGPGGSWFRQVITNPHARISGIGRAITVRLIPGRDTTGDDIDEAYRSKYGRDGFGAAMTTPAAAATTLRLEPADPS